MTRDAKVDDLIEYADALYDYAHRGWWASNAQLRSDALDRIASLAAAAAAELDSERERALRDLLGAAISAPCVEWAHASLARPDAAPAPGLPDRDALGDEEALALLPRIRDTGDAVEHVLHEWVGLLRQRGLTWNDIGAALGVSRQAAWLRFGPGRATPAT